MNRRSTTSAGTRDRVFVSALFIGVLSCATASAVNIYWDSGGGTNTAWETAANWDNADLLPDADDNAYINNGGTAVFSASSGATEIKRSFVAEVNGSSGTLIMTGGTLKNALSNSGLPSRVGRRGNGVVNQSGGLLRYGQRLEVGADGGTGTLNLSGGELEIYRTGTSALYTPRVSLDLVQGAVNISGGAFETRGGVGVGTNGVFNVQGSDSTSINIGSYSDTDGLWIHRAGGVLQVGIDGTATGVTKIFIDDYLDDGGGDVTFDAGALLQVDFVGAALNSGTFVVMEWEGTVTGAGNLAFAPGVDTDIWSFHVDEAGKQLTVTAAVNLSILGRIGFFLQ